MGVQVVQRLNSAPPNLQHSSLLPYISYRPRRSFSPPRTYELSDATSTSSHMLPFDGITRTSLGSRKLNTLRSFVRNSYTISLVVMPSSSSFSSSLRFLAIIVTSLSRIRRLEAPVQLLLRALSQSPPQTGLPRRLCLGDQVLGHLTIMQPRELFIYK